ncbi:hypothetical protein HK097_005863 [Rhizophlyctis rosea]|uniref:DUF3669 domain-containing protein n=1 Tax=Rhizophlyctis rosea TaxID=64517 RepID=A0AAD5SEN7_9FUNG|nr:hypothetical protein HK097_005863 [Rhizophlyctis rosea]
MTDKSTGSEDYDEHLVRIGAGTFAAVYVTPEIVGNFAPPGVNKCLFLGKLFIARLLLGRVDDAERSAPRQFFSVYNFPLTAAKCQTIGLPVIDIAKEMGRAYAALHMIAEVDGRDVKFVIGGTGRRSNGVGFGVGTQMTSQRLALALIDFDQVQRWSKQMDDIDELVSAFLDVENEAYAPRPHQGDTDGQQSELYNAFKAAYLGACAEVGSEEAQLGLAFVASLETSYQNV